MRKYKVKIGVHVQDGHEYKTGEVVTTSMNLIKMFPEKFEDLGPAAPPTPPAKEAEPADEDETAEDEQPPVASRQPPTRPKRRV